MIGKRKQDPTAPGFEVPELIAQEESLVFDAFTQEDALRLGQIMVDLSREGGLVSAVEVFLNGMVVFKYMPEGTGRLNDVWMEKKIQTVLLTGWSTMRAWAMHEAIGVKRAPSMLPNEEYVTCGGGFPIRVKNAGVIGAVACSGPGDQNEHELCTEALKRL